MSGWLVVAHGSIEEAEARFQSCTAVAMLSSGHCRRTRSRRRLDAVDGDVALAREITNGRDDAFRNRTAALLAHFDIHPNVDDPRTAVNDYFVGRARTAVASGDEEAASKILYTFVNKEWFQQTYNSGRRPITHKGDKIGHVGYWCYEGAAFAKVLGIDDSRLEGHKYYPWDLAHP